MQFEQFYLEALGHASYLVGSQATGEALVVDPRRDVEVYLDAAARAGVRVAYVLDSHQHNDYLSSIRELVERAGASALGSAEANLGYDHQPVADGHELELGDVGVKIVHTPGHTPEHVSVLVYDGEHDRDEPALLLSGGALLVGLPGPPGPARRTRAGTPRRQPRRGRRSTNVASTGLNTPAVKPRIG